MFTRNAITVFDKLFVFIVIEKIFLTLLRKCTKFVACQYQWGEPDGQTTTQTGGWVATGYPSTGQCLL